MTRIRDHNDKTKKHRARLLVGACVLMLALGCLAAALLPSWWEREEQQADNGVPLGVEQAVIVRYRGPRLKAQPYRRGASVNLRIANEAQVGDLRVYDIRYVVSLPGKFDLTDYLTSMDGQTLEGLPPFRVRGLTSLTKDIETRIQEIETVGVHIWHGYYETLAGLGAFWAVWLLGLVFVGRPRRKARPKPAPPPPTLVEQIDRLLVAAAHGELTVAGKARLETLLLRHWRRQLGLSDDRMAVSCRTIEASREWGGVYRTLQAWLHDDRADVGSEDFIRTCTQPYSLHPTASSLKPVRPSNASSR